MNLVCRAATAAIVAGAIAGVATRRSRSPRMTRTNFAGRAVSLWEGPAVVAGLAVAPGAARIAAVGAGLCGVIDDHFGDASTKGLRGHLSSLAAGELTTGSLKIAGLAGTGIVAAAKIDQGARRPVASLVGAAVIAGAANLSNLFDLRPGRALKVTLLIGLPAAVAGSQSAVILNAVAIAVAADDLAGRSMLGDTGANPLGAVLGVSIVESTGLPGRLAALALIITATLASEKVSFSAIIEANPVLRSIDAWGRP